MPTDRIHVWLDDVHVADIEKRAWNDLRCRYTEDALESWPLNSPLLSCSLPLGTRPLRASPYLKGLLPEGQALATLAARANLTVNDTFELLERYGRDIAGALVIARETPTRARWGAEPYDEDSLADEVGSLEDHPLGTHDDSELSLAGIQNKLLLVRREDGGWARPLHGLPSTHILKAEDRRFPQLARREADCLTLGRMVGLTSIEPIVTTIGEIPCLIVDRFDRVVADGSVRRVHQEDLCQAVGLDPSLRGGRAKYQRSQGGGPGLADAAALLDRYARHPRAALRQLVRATVFTVVVGNADAHGKNLAFLHVAANAVELAPLYDVVPTLLWPQLTRELAMSINDKFSIDAITLADVVSEGIGWALARSDADDAARTCLDELAAAASTADIADDLRALVIRRVANLQSGVEVGAAL